MKAFIRAKVEHPFLDVKRLGSPERLQMTDDPKAILGTPIRSGPVQDQKREQAPWLPRWRGKLLASDRGSMPKAYEFLLREERQDVKGGTTQPLLVRFASPVLRDGQPRPLPGARHTFVARETTADTILLVTASYDTVLNMWVRLWNVVVFLPSGWIRIGSPRRSGRASTHMGTSRSPTERRSISGKDVKSVWYWRNVGPEPARRPEPRHSRVLRARDTRVP